MEKETDSKEYRLNGLIIGDQYLDLSQNKDSFLLKTKNGTKDMIVNSDNITNVYIK